MHPEPGPRWLHRLVAWFLAMHIASYAAVNVFFGLSALVSLLQRRTRETLRAGWPEASGRLLAALVGWMLVAQLLSSHTWVEGADTSWRLGYKPALALTFGYAVAAAHAGAWRRILDPVAVVFAVIVLPMLPSYDGYRMSMSESVFGIEILGPNVLGGVLAVLVLIGLSVRVVAPGRGPWPHRLVVAVLAVGALLTGSRTTVVMLCVGVVALLGWRLRGRSLLAAAGLGGLLLAGAVAVQPRLLNPDDTSVALQFRLCVWGRGMEWVRRHPLFGVGARELDEGMNGLWPPDPTLEPNTIPVVAGRVECDRLGNPAELHDAYLTMAAQYGLPALALFLALLAQVLRVLWRAGHRDPDPERAAFLRGAFAALVGLLAYQLANPTWFNKELGPFAFCVVGVALGTARRVPVAGRPRDQDPTGAGELEETSSGSSGRG